MRSKLFVITLMICVSIIMCSCSNESNKEITAEKAYYDAINIKVSELETISGNTCEYEGLVLSSSDVNGLSSEDKVSQGSLYRSVAIAIEQNIVDEKKFNERQTLVILGTSNEMEKDELEDYVENISLIVSTNNPIGEVLSHMNDMSASDGTFDFIDGVFDFTISDVSVASEELGITEELMGYIFAWLKEYGAEIRFSEDGNCSISMKYYGSRELSKNDFVPYVDYEEEINVLDDLEEGSYHFYIKDDSVENKTNDEIKADDTDFFNFSTAKGIQLSHSKNAVTLLYGKTALKTVISENDIMMNAIRNNNSEFNEDIKNCKSYMVYSYGEKGQIIFYFDDSDKVHMIVYTNVIIY